MKILNIIKTLALIDLFQGLIVTLKNFFRRKVTVQYPEVKTPISNRFRGKLALMKYEMAKNVALLVSFVRLFVLPMQFQSIQKKVKMERDVPQDLI